MLDHDGPGGPRDLHERRDEALLDRIVNLRQPDHRHIDAGVQQRIAGEFRGNARIGVAGVEDVLAGQLAMSGAAHADAGRDHQRPVGTGERGAERGNDMAVLFAVLDKPREIMVERRVDHGVRLRRTIAQALGILERAAMHLGARGGQRIGAGVGTGDADHLVACLDEFGNQRRTDETGRTGEKDTHANSPAQLPA